jgi:hypothetical protein
MDRLIKELEQQLAAMSPEDRRVVGLSVRAIIDGSRGLKGLIELPMMSTVLFLSSLGLHLQSGQPITSLFTKAAKVAGPGSHVERLVRDLAA